MSVRSNQRMSGKLLAALLGGVLVVTGSAAAAAMPDHTSHQAAEQKTASVDSWQSEEKEIRSEQDEEAAQKTIAVLDSTAQSVQTLENESAEIPDESSREQAAVQQAEQTDRPSQASVSEPRAVPASEAAVLPAEPMDPAESESVQSVQAAQTAQTDGSSQPADDGIWHIHYIPTRGALSAPADGEIGLWADGWFIAHSGLENGDRIATFPPRVEVDGRTYHLSDTWVSEDAITPQEVARIRANDGIAFQTCIDDATNWMAHYEPDGAGYGYQFTNYPYTVNDDASIGYYPQDYSGSTPAVPVQTTGQQNSASDESGFQAFDE